MCSLVVVGENASPMGGRGRGEERPERTLGGERDAAALSRSSVALRRASRASSSEVWEDTLSFLGVLVGCMWMWWMERGVLF